MEQVYFGRLERVAYPSGEQCWSPSESYPEYQYSDCSTAENGVYRLIRDGFRALGYDAAHADQPEWNPLGDLIRPGMTVLLKPNWVLHKNDDPSHDMNCVVTHPSVIRAVLDYVLLALKGTGRVIVGDAPIQICDFEALHRTFGYDKLWSYYREKGVALEVKDFRGLVAHETSTRMNVLRNQSTGIVVDLGKQSMFSGWSADKVDRMRVTNYATGLMKQHHNAQKHEYMIHPCVLEADVILNLAKPKSHRKAGLTACAKNFVGACMRKEDLPHHTTGSRAENGDEYQKKSMLHAVQSKVLDLKNDSDYAGERRFFLYKWLYKGIRAVQKLSGAEQRDFSEGSWYGNDTIWRTIVDLNHILRFADQTGALQSTPQRSIFNVCDMIIAGEGEGPLKPSPKPLGGIVMSGSIWAADRFICRLAGFSTTAIRYLDALPDRTAGETSFSVVSAQGNATPIEAFAFDPACFLRPTAGWKGRIESEDRLA
ncbi:MAG: DUF362 domain-containing protein [Clostridiaceae bacterium]